MAGLGLAPIKGEGWILSADQARSWSHDDPLRKRLVDRFIKVCDDGFGAQATTALLFAFADAALDEMGHAGEIQERSSV